MSWKSGKTWKSWRTWQSSYLEEIFQKQNIPIEFYGVDI